ncbi:hypothetical protein [uncultured Roseibium sp.]|nr:hypothetical protein [uncultured Roseibium sp.]
MLRGGSRRFGLADFLGRRVEALTDHGDAVVHAARLAIPVWLTPSVD